MNKGAIFDVDGTLLDSMPIWENASERFLEGLGIEAEPGLNEIMFRMSLDEGAAYLRSAYNLAMTDQEIKEGVLGVIRDFYFYKAQPKPGALEFLQELKERHIYFQLLYTRCYNRISNPKRERDDTEDQQILTELRDVAAQLPQYQKQIHQQHPLSVFHPLILRP